MLCVEIRIGRRQWLVFEHLAPFIDELLVVHFLIPFHPGAGRRPRGDAFEVNDDTLGLVIYFESILAQSEPP